MKFCQLDCTRGDDCNAFTKAPSDAARIALDLGFRLLVLRSYGCRIRFLSLTFGCVLRILQDWIFRFYLRRADVLFLQYPSPILKSEFGADYIARLRKSTGVRVITLVHDLDFLRFTDERLGLILDVWNKIRAVTDCFIVHNLAMRQKLVDLGLSADRLVVLGLFDYLASSGACKADYQTYRTVTIAGNLDLTKATYLQDLKSIKNVTWKLYGPHINKDLVLADNVAYEGCVPAAEILQHLTSGFGLVWDGVSVDTCEGPMGEYLKFNNPHKLSQYLAAGLPVIVWSRAAIAEFVQQEGVGIAVSTLRDVPLKIDSMSLESYQKMRVNAMELSKRLRNGEFLSMAIKNALKVVQRGDEK